MKITIMLTFMILLMCPTSEIQKLDIPKAKVSYTDF